MPLLRANDGLGALPEMISVSEFPDLILLDDQDPRQAAFVEALTPIAFSAAMQGVPYVRTTESQKPVVDTSRELVASSESRHETKRFSTSAKRALAGSLSLQMRELQEVSHHV
jgi:hypothetical protein